MRFLCASLLLLSATSSFGKSAAVCAGDEKPAVFGETKADVEKQIDAFANRQPVASQADALLSKLIAAKSPVLNSWLAKRDFANASEEAIAKAWRNYYARNFVLTKYPQGDAAIDTATEKLVDGLIEKHLGKSFVARLEKIFDATKARALETVGGMKIAEKPALVERIKNIRLYWPAHLKSARNNAIPLDLISWGIAYDPVPNEINVGLEALSYPNDETYEAVFAHEIGHAFDSCRWGAFFKGPWPFEKVGACLRSAKSVAALARDDKPLDRLVAEKKVDATLALALKQNPTCNKMAYPPAGVQADQLPEAFADWFSAEVVAHEPKLNVAHLRADLCGAKDLREGSSYPTNHDRLFRLYLAQPKLKALAKSPAEVADYCPLE